ncbi:hypothetical protein Tco_0957038 [Tanacetum coccineum]
MVLFPNALWVKVIKAIHGQEGDFDTYGCKFNAPVFDFGRTFGLVIILLLIATIGFIRLGARQRLLNLLIEFEKGAKGRWNWFIVSSNLIHRIKLCSPGLTLSHLFMLTTLLSLPNGIQFFWGGQDSKKLIWIKWANVLSFFEKGGLNFGSLNSFNLALLQKWLWRWFFFPNALWVKVIKAIHGQEGGFDTYGCKFNGIWARIFGSSNFFHLKNIIPLNYFCFKAGCSTRIRFWKDIWISDSPLTNRYNRLYRLELDKDCLIINRIENGQWRWNWSRNDLGVRNTAYFRDLLIEISRVDISTVGDTCIWCLTKNDIFPVKEARRVIDDKILPSLATLTSWDKTLPRKVNIFMWRLMLDRLPHRLNLSSHG